MTTESAKTIFKGTTMPGMTKHRTTERHASKTRRDHLWVLAVIAAFALYDVWGGWTHIGNESGFPHGTGWTLTVIVEVYWGYALYAWLAAAPGPRSRKFAMWSAGGVFILSLAGQAAAHLAAHKMPPVGVVVFVSALPVIVLALIAILVHLRHIDRAEMAEGETESAGQAELAAVRAELSEAREAAKVMQAGLDAARAETAEAVAKAEVLARKPAGTAKPKGAQRGTRKQGRGSGTAAANAERTFDELLADARAYRAELATAGKGERPTKERLRLRFGVSSGTALAVCRALKDDEPIEAPEAPGAVG